MRLRCSIHTQSVASRIRVRRMHRAGRREMSSTPTRLDVAEYLRFYVPVPRGRLTPAKVDAMVAMAAARLRYELGARYKTQIRDRAVARCAANAARAAKRKSAAAQQHSEVAVGAETLCRTA